MARMMKMGGGMARLLMILLWAVLAAGTAMADAPWTGRWQLNWSNGGALVNLSQEGSAVGGSFGSGQIKGTVNGRLFEGEIVYNGGSETLHATLSEDGASFAGTTESGDWLSAERIVPGSPQALLQMDLSSPRSALRSFIVAAGLARADKSYAMSSAIDALDFGSNPGWATREERFNGAQQMYQLIDRATFTLATIPDETAQSPLTLSLAQIDNPAVITISMVRGAEGNWRIVMPPPDKLRAELGSGPLQPADAFRQLQNPRDTLRAFLVGMRTWDSGGEALALSTIDLSTIPEVLRSTEGTIAAQYLIRIIDQVGHRTLQNVPNSGVSREPFVLFELPAGSVVIEPVGNGKDTRWQFSAETVRQLRTLYRAVEQLPANHALDPSFIPYSPMFAMRGEVKRYAPWLLKGLPGPGHVEYWQLLASLLGFATIALMTVVLRALLLWVMNRPLLQRHVANPRRLSLGVALGASFIFGAQFIGTVGLPAATRQYTVPVIGTLLLLILAYALWQVIVFVLSVFQEVAEKTETAFDNILITFSAGLAKLLIVIGAVMGLSYLWSLPTSGLLAGLGISGLAVAFASKETLANIFGAGILLGDRPFRKGDRIVAGDVNGWVEAVGLRSTRVRTLYDSMLVVPNAKLADMVVDNLGARRRRSLLATVIVTAGATPQRMEAFVEAIRQRVNDDPIFEGKWAEVRISRFWTEGIDVEISTMLETRSGRQAREATHKLYLDIMRIADGLGLSLAHATAASATVSAPAAAAAEPQRS